MRKILIYIAIIIAISNISFSQTYNWITPNKAYLKLFVNDDGIYRISRTDFTNAGISTTSIDPRTVKVFNKGVEIPIFFQGESDGVFDAADYLDFYGTRNYGGLTKYYTVNNALYYTKDEHFNLYSDTNVYWVGWDGSNGQRFSTANFTTSTPFGSSTFTERAVLEKDKIYTQGERANANDFRNFNNELFQGEGWYWSSMYTNLTVSDTVSTPLLTTVPQTATVKIFAYPDQINTSVLSEHNLIIKLNGNTIGNIYKNDFDRFDTTLSFSTSIMNTASVNTFQAQYFGNGSNVLLLFDFFKLDYPKVFKFRNNQISSTLSSDTTSKQFRITGYIPANPLSIYDVSNNQRITSFSNSSDTLIFTGKSNAKFEIINKTITKKPFRISQRLVPDLTSATNGADYLLVYNSLFTAQAEQLRNYRATKDNYRSVKAEITDVYDIFNYGLENPVAIRNFTRYVNDYWQAPKNKFLCLMGRGSLDPKKNATATVYNKNLIPVKGNPTSDSYFANFGNEASTFTFSENIAVGRLTAYTAAEAQIMVNNIISYEAMTPDLWWKNFTFIIGGGTLSDQTFFQSLINPMVSSNITPAPVSGIADKIYRGDYTTTVTYNYKDSIRRDINNGTMIANFQGHAGNENWEDGMQDPATLSNFGKLPFVLSMTCYTGRTADAENRVFGETFMNMANRGAVGFLGSTGWGFAYSGSTLQNWILYGMAKDTLRRIGELVKYGNNKIAFDSVSSSNRHSINCYGLIGDPAVKLAFPKQPEFEISSSEYKLSNDFPVLNETVYITIYPKNYGLYADSCKIRFNLKKDNITIQSRDTVLKAFKYSDSVSYSFKLDSLKKYSVEAILDYSNWYPNDLKTNNTLSVNLPLKNISYVTIKPIDNSIVKPDSVEFIGLNPVTNQNMISMKVLLEMDTTKSFNSPLKKSFANSSITGVVTKFKTSIPILSSSIIYYWRTNSILNNDSTGWTKAQSFSYNPTFAEPTPNENKKIKVNINSDNDDVNIVSLADSNNIILAKFKSNQFSQYDLYNTNFGTGGISLNSHTLTLSARSMGNNGAEISYLNVNDKGLNIDGGRSPGLNMMKVRRLNGSVIDIKNFRMTSGSSSDSVVNFLNTFDSTYYLIAVNSSYVDYSLVQVMSATCKTKIRSFGSTKIDSVDKFGWFDTWSFIGYPGATASNVSEQYFKYTQAAGWRESLSTIVRKYNNTYGTVANIIGPAQSWNNFSWVPTLIANSTVLFDVIGIDKNGIQTLLMSNQNLFNGVSLSSINAYQYPYLNLLAKISIDTITGFNSSYLTSVNARYFAPCELISNRNTLKITDTLVTVGKEIKINFNYHNVGYTSMPGAIVNIYKNSPLASNLIKSDTISSTLKIDSLFMYSNKITVPYFRTGSDNRLPVYIEVIPKGSTNEFYTYNNPLPFNLYINSIINPANLQLFSDGALAKSGDKVRSNPEMKIIFTDNSDNNSYSKVVSDTKTNSDTSGLIVRLNEINIPYYLSGKLNSALKIADVSLKDGSNENAQTIFYYPSLKEGINKLTLIYKTGFETSDTVYYDFVVSNQLALKDLYNFPNPMKDETNFVFNLEGSSVSLESKIKIYTASGKLIREIKFPANSGYNQIRWDGKDNDGDFIANGTYLYKIVTENDSKTETTVQKLVVLR